MSFRVLNERADEMCATCNTLSYSPVCREQKHQIRKAPRKDLFNWLSVMQKDPRLWRYLDICVNCDGHEAVHVGGRCLTQPTRCQLHVAPS